MVIDKYFFITFLVLSFCYFPKAIAQVNCQFESIRCVGPGEEYNTLSPSNQPEVAFQNAVNDAEPGNFVYIRGGTYVHSQSATNSNVFLSVRVSGTTNNPITISSYPGEWARIEGWGYSEDGSIPSTNNELIYVTGDYITIRNLQLGWSSREGLKIHGNNGYYTNLIVHDCFGNNIELSHGNVQVENNLIEYVESRQSRHGYGIAIMRSDDGSNTTFTQNNTIRNSISYRNGYYGSPGNYTKVPGISGDSAGGGNSDGFFAYKNCHDVINNGADNVCPNNHFIGNIAWDNADDGFDTSFGEGSSLIGNITFSNGPEGERGFKVLRYVRGTLSFIGNIAMSNDARGFETRASNDVLIAHNLSTNHSQVGIFAASNNPSSDFRVQNNIVTNNQSNITSAAGATVSHNLVESGEVIGDEPPPNNECSPDTEPPSSILFSPNSSTAIQRSVSDSNFSGGSDTTENFASALDTSSKYTAFTPDTSCAPTRVSLGNPTIAACWENITNQFRNRYALEPGDLAIDAGTVINGVHCPRADDDPSNPYDPDDTSCRHWSGAAPDIGPYEYVN